MKTIHINASPAQFKKITAYIEKIGAKVVKATSQEITSKKQDVHPYLLETEVEHKRIKNEIIKKYNRLLNE